MGLKFAILLIPFLYSIICIFLPGAAILSYLNKKGIKIRGSSAGKILLSFSTGLLWNMILFIPIIISKRYNSGEPGFLIPIKFILDLLLLGFVLVNVRENFSKFLKDCLSIFLKVENICLFILALVIGIFAVLRFPHVYDSGQLMATNWMMMDGTDFFAAKRYGIGFSALIYFPAILFRSIPMTTMASGFKPVILMLLAITSIYGVKKIGSSYGGYLQFLYFFISVFSFYGIYGILELGKDSIWAILFLIIFMFSLIENESKISLVENLIYGLCAIVMGMISIPYIAIFFSLFIFLHLLPVKLTNNRFLFFMLIVVLLLTANYIMPVRIPIGNSEFFHSRSGMYSYLYPANGIVPFTEYFLFYKMYRVSNAFLISLLGLIGILVFPFFKNRFKGYTLKAMAIFPLVTIVILLLIIIFSNGFKPVSQNEKIPFIFLSTFNLWNLFKDVPQWFLALIPGIFIIMGIDEILKRFTKSRFRLYSTGFIIGGLLLVGVIYPNLKKVMNLTKPAFFYTYGGNRNRDYAILIEHIYLNRSVTKFYYSNAIKKKDISALKMDCKHMMPLKWEVREIMKKENGVLFPTLPAMILIKRNEISNLEHILPGRKKVYYYLLHNFESKDEVLYIISEKKEDYYSIENTMSN